VIFTPGATYSLNMLLKGFLRAGDHVITTSMEHNAVMRPLHALAGTGIAHDAVPCGRGGSLEAAAVIPFIKRETRAVVMTHASNVCGAIMPLEAVSEICQKFKLKLIVDAAQTAGVLDIDARGVDALAFAGHKGLLAAPGLGGLVVKGAFADEIAPLVTGGTGSLSHGIEQPDFLPDKFESGTMNIPAIIGLKKALEYISLTGIKTIRDRERGLASAFISRIRGLGGLEIIGPESGEARVAIVSVDFPGRDNARVARLLDNDYGIMTRCGLPCAPLAHRTIGTYPRGTVRFSFGHFNTLDEVEYIAGALEELLRKR
jgi:cysteine desulfurase family protein